LTYLMNAHRLDSETSGVILLAKSKPVLVALANLFGSEAPRRHFLALVSGAPPEDRFEICASLAPDPARPGMMRVDARHGKRSRTLFEVLERFLGWTLLQADLRTARAHQVRAHLQRASFPIVGDEMYGGKPLMLSRLKPNYRLKPGRSERPLLSRPALHSARLALPHPITGEPMEITAPWPKDILVAIKYLRRWGEKAPITNLQAPENLQAPTTKPL
jgi:23S rRNA-/tRNA-specific pseudouridylate synthase